MKQASDHSLTPGGRWPHRFAWILLCAIFPLIWIGGAVTTYHAGMSVPDWPTTYGSWFYPIHLWLRVWDLFLEHSHREWARWVVGTSTLALVAAIWLQEQRKWMRWMAVAVLAGVCLQAVLGGFRVLCDDLLLARVHACTAPVVFALVAAVVSVTSRPWLAHGPARKHPAARRLRRLVPAIVAAVYLEIVLGTQLRHPPIGLGPGWFQFCVWAKVILAGLIVAAAAWLLVAVPRACPTSRSCCAACGFSRWSWQRSLFWPPPPGSPITTGRCGSELRLGRIVQCSCRRAAPGQRDQPARGVRIADVGRRHNRDAVDLSVAA